MSFKKFFNRQLRLVVGKTSIQGLHLSFDVEKSLEPKANPARVVIWNLNPENRQVLLTKIKKPLELQVGYGAELFLLFKGNIYNCEQSHEDVDHKTVLCMGDGLADINAAQIAQSFSKDLSSTELLQYTVKTFQDIDYQQALKCINNLPCQNLSTATALYGPSLRVLNDLLRKHKLSASIQNHKLHIHGLAGQTSAQATRLDANSGLLGKTTMGPTKLKVKALLQTGLDPGQLIAIDNDAKKQEIFCITQSKYTGSNYDDNWHCDLQAEKINL